VDLTSDSHASTLVVHWKPMRILLVEDNELQRDSLKSGLAATGYMIDAVADGEDGLRQATGNTYDLIILDVMLPRLSGLEILRRLRAEGRSTPVLMLTARDGVEDRVAGLDLGADDYLTKPFAFAEFLARVRALIRRGHQSATPHLTVGDLEIDSNGHTARRGGVEIPLTPREFAVLEYLCLRAGAVVTRQELCEHLYELDSDPDSNALDVFVSRLRRKLSLPGHPAPIQTRRGHGYILTGSRQVPA
jgi:DNA-binding response OmpR family regulator